jgi:uridine kinase
MQPVVGVAGAGGAGKTTLVRGLVAALGDACAIHMDSYQRITRRPVREIVAWLERGGDFDEFDIPLLGEHLQRLRRGEPVLDPLTMEEIPGRGIVVFETHFGRRHRDTGRHIDLLLWLDAPLDVALARNVRGLLEPLLAPQVEPGRAEVERMHGYVTSYLTDVRRLVLAQRDTVAADADVVLDASLAPAQVVERALAAIRARWHDPGMPGEAGGRG